MNNQPGHSLGPRDGTGTIRSRMDADLPGLMREVRWRARRRNARAVFAGALCFAPVLWAAAYLTSPRSSAHPDRVVAGVGLPDPTPIRDLAPDGINSYVIDDDEFFRLMSRAGYEVGLVRTGGETIVVGFEPQAREEHDAKQRESAPRSSLE